MMHFDPGIIRNITLPNIKDGVLGRLKDEGYTPKPEQHVTLVTAAVRSRLNDGQVDALLRIADSIKDSHITFEDVLYEIEKPKQIEGQIYPRESVVVLVTSDYIWSQLAGFAMKQGVLIPEPFLHVTVATKPNTEVAARGIGIESEAEWQNLSPRIYAVDWMESR